jgi:thiol-disulfide isomerase/thioredoxin
MIINIDQEFNKLDSKYKWPYFATIEDCIQALIYIKEDNKMSDNLKDVVLRAYHGRAAILCDELIAKNKNNETIQNLILISAYESSKNEIDNYIKQNEINSYLRQNESATEMVGGMVTGNIDDSDHILSELLDSLSSENKPMNQPSTAMTKSSTAMTKSSTSMTKPSTMNQPSTAMTKPSTAMDKSNDTIFDVFDESVNENNKSVGKTSSTMSIPLNKAYLILFWGEWCSASRKFKPIWDHFKSKYTDEFSNVELLDYHIGNNPSENAKKITEFFDIYHVPTLVFFNNGILKKLEIGKNVEEIYKNISDILKRSK